jgi:uncharacterized protein (DUF362 family)
MPRVLIIRPGPGDVRKCLEFMDAATTVRGKKVLVKPNLTTNMAADTGVTTHPYLISGVVEYLLESGAERVVLGEGCYGKVRPTYESLGFFKLADELGIEIVDFWEDEPVEVKVGDPLARESFGIARTVLEADLIFNIPVMKIHGGESQVTLCAKNMMGCIARDKSFMHQNFDSKIIDLLGAVSPHLNIVDGIVGMEGQEIHGKAVGANVLVAGNDFVAVDSVCTWIMGFNPGEVRHVERAGEYGFGCADPDLIDISGLSLEEVRRPFERATY